MLTSSPSEHVQADLFRKSLDQMIDMRHRLVLLSHAIDWCCLDSEFSHHYNPSQGRPGKSIRLMCGLLLLKEIEGVSDETVCARWAENPYWQFFCGEHYFQHRFPIAPESLVYFRQRIGESGMERLLQETIAIGLCTKLVHPQEVHYVTVDTTVQEKVIAFPTDTRLQHKAREKLVSLCEAHGLQLRQNYKHLSKKALLMANRYANARQMKRCKRKRKDVKNYLGRVIRNVKRLLDQRPDLGAIFASILHKSEQLFNQEVKSKGKLYAWHAPEVECISKGKSHKKYEFGCKASFAVTNGGNFIVGAKAYHGNPHDSKTLSSALDQVTQLTGIRPREAQVDQGYKGHGITDTRIIMARQKSGVTRAIRKRQKRRNAIEPIIGHCKNDRAIGSRNWLKGEIGDKINTIAMAIGYNLRKILEEFFALIRWIISAINNIRNHNNSELYAA